MICHTIHWHLLTFNHMKTLTSVKIPRKWSRWLPFPRISVPPSYKVTHWWCSQCQSSLFWCPIHWKWPASTQVFGEYILTCLIHSYIFFINNKQNYSSFCVRRQNYSSPVSHFTLLFWKIWSALINDECPLWENTLQRRTFVTNMSVEIKKIMTMYFFKVCANLS